MARRGRPASESYQPVFSSSGQLASISSEAVGLEDDADREPIFSISKSSMDVVMATGPPHERDPSWTRMDLRRSYSTNARSEPHSATHKRLHPHLWQHIGAVKWPPQVQNVEVHSPPAHGERWFANRQRWSQGSGGTQSRSSTPETIVWRDRTSRPPSLTPDSPTSKPASPLTSTSPFISPTSPPGDLLTPSSFTNLNMHPRKDLPSPATPPPLLPPKSQTSSPMPSLSPTTEEEVFLEDNLLFFTFPSHQLTPVSLAGGGGAPGRGDDVIEGLQSPSSEDGGGGRLGYLMLNSPTKTEDAGPPVVLGDVCPAVRGWGSPLVSSRSDSQLGESCRCSLKTREDLTKIPKGGSFKDEGTMTSQLELADAAVQTVSPPGSSWGLMRNLSTSNMGSHSILGSPPGSRLNLKSSVGSHSNLVSPSSSMFPVSSGEEEKPGGDPTWSSSLHLSSSPHGLERRRSCLKIQGEESDGMGRRGSMKQVQWDENGMTWDVHGASPDQEVLTAAIRKYLEVHNSPPPKRPSSKKKKAPKPPLISNVVKAMAPELHPPVMIPMPTCMVEGGKGDTPDGVPEDGVGGGRKEEREESDGRRSNAEVEEEEIRDEGDPKSPSRGGGTNRKRSVMRALRRPRWCGGSSRTADD